MTEYVALETAVQECIDLNTLMVMLEETLISVIIDETSYISEYYPGMINMLTIWWNSTFLLFPMECMNIKYMLENDEDEVGYVNVYCTAYLNGMLQIEIFTQPNSEHHHE